MRWVVSSRGERRIVTRFALLPIRLFDNSIVWLQKYHAIQSYEYRKLNPLSMFIFPIAIVVMYLFPCKWVTRFALLLPMHKDCWGSDTRELIKKFLRNQNQQEIEKFDRKLMGVINE